MANEIRNAALNRANYHFITVFSIGMFPIQGKYQVKLCVLVLLISYLVKAMPSNAMPSQLQAGRCFDLLVASVHWVQFEILSGFYHGFHPKNEKSFMWTLIISGVSGQFVSL